MSYNIPDRVFNELSRYARRRNVEKLILFGSRARGTHTDRSDIDLAVICDDFDPFYWDVTENAHTLLMFDIVDLKRCASEELKKEIERDGIVIYEKA